jgi:hypothetical protein
VLLHPAILHWVAPAAREPANARPGNPPPGGHGSNFNALKFVPTDRGKRVPEAPQPGVLDGPSCCSTIR